MLEVEKFKMRDINSGRPPESISLGRIVNDNRKSVKTRNDVNDLEEALLEFGSCWEVFWLCRPIGDGGLRPGRPCVFDTGFFLMRYNRDDLMVSTRAHQMFWYQTLPSLSSLFISNNSSATFPWILDASRSLWSSERRPFR